MKKILIIQTAFIGDVILATSLIKACKAAFPEAQVDFLLRKGNESLVENNPHICWCLDFNTHLYEFVSGGSDSVWADNFLVDH